MHVEKQDPSALASTLQSSNDDDPGSSTGGSSYPISLPNATGNFSFTAAVLLELSTLLCSSSLTAKTTYWSTNKYAGYAQAQVPSQGVASLDILSSCGSSATTTALAVKNLANPITMAIPTSTDNLALNPTIEVACNLGVSELRNVTCTYGVSGTVVIGVTCNGTVESVSYRCPSRPRCVFWNDTLKAWSDKGCTTVSSSNDLTTCECNHLTSFATIDDTSDYVLATLESARHIDKAYLKKNFGILVTVGVLYIVYLLAVIIVRVRRTKDSLQYLR